MSVSLVKGQAPEWRAVQVCGECGRGRFRMHGDLVLCSVCAHEHTMDSWNLGEGERFEWVAGSLAVASYAVAGE